MCSFPGSLFGSEKLTVAIIGSQAVLRMGAYCVWMHKYFHRCMFIYIYMDVFYLVCACVYVVQGPRALDVWLRTAANT